jgi:hypothetical protein
MTIALDRICKIANERKVTPKILIELFNQYITKPYTHNDVSMSLDLTDRYARRYFDKRENNVNWSHNTYTEFRSDRRG